MSTPVQTIEAPIGTSSSKTMHRGAANLVRWPKGQSGNPSGLPKDGRGPLRTLKQLGRSLMQEIEHDLAKDGGIRFQKLAHSIVEGAIKREPACLAFIGPRLAPILQASTANKVVVQGIRLELSSGDTANVQLVQAIQVADACDSDADSVLSESHRESNPEDGSAVTVAGTVESPA